VGTSSSAGALDRPGPGGELPLPTDVLPALGWTVLILLGVPALAGLAGILLLRKVIITPFGVVRRTRERRPSVLPGILIIGGVFAPFVVKPLGTWLDDHFGHRYSPTVYVTIGVLLVVAAIFGVILGTGWIAYTIGRLLQRYGRRAGMLLAGRPLMADPWSGSRMFAALLAAVIVGAGAYGYRAQMRTDFAADALTRRALGDGDGPGVDTSFYFARWTWSTSPCTSAWWSPRPGSWSRSPRASCPGGGRTRPWSRPVCRAGHWGRPSPGRRWRRWCPRRWWR
jgi:hypothetical protein